MYSGNFKRKLNLTVHKLVSDTEICNIESGSAFMKDHCKEMKPEAITASVGKIF